MATDKKKHLDCVIESHRISKEQDLLDKHLAKRTEIKEAIEEKFGDKIYAPFNSGSLAKYTAINKKFDIDLMVPFKRNAFTSSGTLEEMFTATYDFIYAKYNTVAIVRKQKVSIGIEFYPDAEGHTVKVDVVPARELTVDQYLKDNYLNLYVSDTFGLISKGSTYLQSNIHEQIKNIKDRATAEKDSIRKIIRLLKIWKISAAQGPKSFFIELIVIKAFDSKDISGNLWEKLKSVLEYIRDNVKTVTLPDPGNGNNDVASSMSDAEKHTLSITMGNMLTNIDSNEDYIKSYFPINAKHPCEEDKKENTYSVKSSPYSAPSSPTSFG